MSYSLLITISASRAEIGENRLKILPSLSMTSLNMAFGLGQAGIPIYQYKYGQFTATRHSVGDSTVNLS